MQNTKIKLSYIYIYIVTMLGIVCFAEAQTTDASKYSEKEKLAKASEELSKNMNTTNIGYFIENKGQWDTDVLFMANSKSLRVWITKKSMVFEQFQVEEIEKSDHRLHEKERVINAHAIALEFLNPHEVDILKSEDISLTPIHFMIGNDPSKHAKNVKSYRDIRLNNIFDGIDIKYYFDEGEVRYDFIVKPYADPNQIIMNIKGATSTEIINNELVMNTSLNPVIQNSLNTYQKDENEVKNEISSSFKLIDDNLSFELGEYDMTKELIIDPLTLLAQVGYGGSSDDRINDIAINTSTSVLVFTGETISSDFPVTLGTYQKKFDIITGSIDQNLNTNWITYFGGTSNDYSNVVAVNDSYVYFAGYTTSDTYPLLNSLNPNLQGDTDAIFTVLNFNGSTLEYSTYIGGTDSQTIGIDECNDMNLRLNGDVYLVGHNEENGNITEVNQITTQTRGNDRRNGFVICLEEIPGGALNYNRKFASVFGGEGHDHVMAIDVDDTENIYIVGSTTSDAASFAITNNAYDNIQNSGGQNEQLFEVFVTKLHLGPNELEIDYNSFFGNNDTDAHRVALAVKYADSKVFFGGFAVRGGIDLLNEFDDRTWTYPEGFIAAIDPKISGSNGLKYSTYIYESNLINDLDYDDNCNKLVFASNCRDELLNYTGTQPTFIGPRDALLGFIDINLVNQYTLTDLIYLQSGSFNYGNAVKINGNFIYLGGYDKNMGNENADIWKVEFESCTYTPCPCPQDVDDWLELEATRSPYFPTVCPQDFCNIIHSLNIPNDVECYSHYRIDGNIYELNGTQLQGIAYCLPPGQSYTVSIDLLESANDLTPCTITKTISCPEVRIEDATLPVPCTPDCSEDYWVMPPMERTFNILGCDNQNSCEVKVTWIYRNSCDPVNQDIQILRIEAGSECYDLCTKEEIYQKSLIAAINYTIAIEPLWEPKLHPNCYTTWRVVGGSCYAEWDYINVTGGDSIKVLEPCLNVECCVQPMTVCREASGKLNIQYDINFTRVYGVDLCNFAWVDNPITGEAEPCIFACDWNKISGVYTPGVLVQAKPSININSEEFIGLRITFENEIAKIEIRNYGNEKLNIKIVDIKGRILSTIDDNLKKGNNEFDLKLTDLVKGSYFIVITIDNKEIKTKPFNIIR